MLNGFLPIYKRELKTFFQSPSTYVVLALLFLVSGLIFHDLLLLFGEMSMAATQGGMFGAPQTPNVTEQVVQPIFQIMTSMCLFVIPLLSMRLIAEEKSRGTLEVLATSPLSDWSILLGKYFALVTVGLVICLISALYPVIIWWVGRVNQSAPEWPVVVSCWIGLILIFAAYAAFGVMASSFTENTMSAGVVTLIGLILWNVIGAFEIQSIPQLRAVVEQLAAAGHTENFMKGLLVFQDFAFYILASFFFLFIASKTLEARRWRI